MPGKQIEAMASIRERFLFDALSDACPCPISRIQIESAASLQWIDKKCLVLKEALFRMKMKFTAI
jgi:hypothetical protein